MYYQKDWLLRQIQMTAQMMAKAVFNKNTPFYEMENREVQAAGDLLHGRLIRLLEEARFNEAENLLFSELEENGIEGLRAALDFYARLNQFDDETLVQNGFEREEIAQGLQDIKNMFGIIL